MNMSETRKCSHPITFQIWLSAVFYYGYFKCKRCGAVIRISDHQNKICKRNTIISLISMFVGIFIGTDLGSKWPIHAAMVVGISYQVISLIYNWKHASRWYTEQERM